jgi:hypothetical protein
VETLKKGQKERYRTMKARKIEYICNAVKWFDKVNGNTDHSVRVTRCTDGAVVVGEFQYGHGEQYYYTALQAMLKANWLPSKYEAAPGFNSNAYLWERENNYPILWNCTQGKKRDCIANGKL